MVVRLVVPYTGSQYRTTASVRILSSPHRDAPTKCTTPWRSGLGCSPTPQEFTPGTPYISSIGALCVRSQGKVASDFQV